MFISRIITLTLTLLVSIGIHTLKCPDWSTRWKELIATSNHPVAAYEKYIKEKEQFKVNQEAEENELIQCRSEITNNSFTVPRLNVDELDNILAHSTPQERLLPTQIPMFLPLYHTVTNNFTCFCGVVHAWYTRNCD